jgi:hypothetical protein
MINEEVMQVTTPVGDREAPLWNWSQIGKVFKMRD